jgi:high-affinity iron transporter
LPRANDAQCCSANINGGGGWGVFNALFGWTNSATYGSVLSYNLYWVAIMAGFAALRYKETRGHWPLLKPGKDLASAADSLSDEPIDVEKSAAVETTKEVQATEVSE